MTTTLPLSILERMLSDIKLDEITQESMEKESDRKAEDEAKLETKQEVEGTATSKKRRTKRAGPDNPKEAVKDRKPSSQKSK